MFVFWRTNSFIGLLIVYMMLATLCFHYGGVIFAQDVSPSDKPAKRCWIARRRPTRQKTKRLIDGGMIRKQPTRCGRDG